MAEVPRPGNAPSQSEQFPINRRPIQQSQSIPLVITPHLESGDNQTSPDLPRVSDAENRRPDKAGLGASKPPVTSKAGRNDVKLPKPTSPAAGSKSFKDSTAAKAGRTEQSVVVGQVGVQSESTSTPSTQLSNFTDSLTLSNETSPLSTQSEKSSEENSESTDDSYAKLEMGAISFKVPGRITHKTTIKIAHYPQTKEIIGIEQPGECTCPEPPEPPECGGQYSNNCNFYTYNISDPQADQYAMQMQQYMMYYQQFQCPYQPQCYQQYQDYGCSYCQTPYYSYSYHN